MAVTLLRSVACLAFLGGANAVSVRAQHTVGGTAALRTAEWMQCQSAEVAERRFWAAEWAGIQSDVESLRAVAEPTAEKKEHEKSPLTGLKINLEPKSPADLAPALAMLKGLYDEGKERIGKLNQREQKLKQQYEQKQVEHAKRLKSIEDRYNNHTLSLEFKTNETRDENRIFSYWERVRERQHKQYHTSLKIQHSTLEKTKTMIDLYEKTIAGNADKSSVQKQLRKVGGMPEIVFLQDRSVETAHACDELLIELRAAVRESQEPVRAPAVK